MNGVGGAVGPELTDYPPATHVDSLGSILRNPPAQMAQIVGKETFTDRQIRDLAAFFRSNIKATQ